MPFNPSPRSIVAAFDIVENDLIEFLARVPLVPEHLAVWSPILVGCIFESCSQLDSLWKLRSGITSDVKFTEHFSVHAPRVAGDWLVVWDGDGHESHPFSHWSGRSKYAPLPWWQAYNALKHNRWKNVKKATIANAVDAAAALFIAIATDSECHKVLAERKWIHSKYGLDYLLRQLSRPEGILGVTVESTLFSYAIQSSHPDFNAMLAHYHACTQRFGKWLEAKFHHPFWLG